MFLQKKDFQKSLTRVCCTMNCIEVAVLNSDSNNTPIWLPYRVIHKSRKDKWKWTKRLKEAIWCIWIVGSEQGGPRPAVVVQNDMGNKHAPTVIIAPVTSKNKKSNLPTHVKLTSHILERNSMVLLEQLKTVDKSRIDSYIGTLSDEEMKMIDKALRISLAIGRYKKRSV